MTNTKTYAVGQFVSLPKPPLPRSYDTLWHEYLNSNVQLTKKDIQRGYYFNIEGKLIELEATVTPDWINSSGKSTQPVSMAKYMKVRLKQIKDISIGSRIFTYILFKGNLTKVRGTGYKGQLYFSGLSGDYYKTKLYVTEDGYVLGVNVCMKDLSPKKQKQCFNVFDDEVLSKHVGFEIIRK